MLEERKPRLFRHIIFYVFVASLTIIVMSAFAVSFKAKLDEPEKCGYTACNEVVNNADPSKAQLLNCRCQCESVQSLTNDCSTVYECVRNETCWRMNKK